MDPKTEPFPKTQSCCPVLAETCMVASGANHVRARTCHFSLASAKPRTELYLTSTYAEQCVFLLPKYSTPNYSNPSLAPFIFTFTPNRRIGPRVG
jgi:hypothetical protein